jgi:hypothetical protein
LGLGSGDITKRLPQRRREARCKEPRINRASNRWFDSDCCDNGNSKDVFDIASTKGATVFFDEHDSRWPKRESRCSAQRDETGPGHKQRRCCRLNELPTHTIFNIARARHAPNIDHDRSLVIDKFLETQCRSVLAQKRPAPSGNQANATRHRVFETLDRRHSD